MNHPTTTTNVTDTTEFYILIQVWMTEPSFRSQLFEKAKTSIAIFSQISKSIRMKFSRLSWHVGFWKLSNFIPQINIQGDDSAHLIS